MHGSGLTGFGITAWRGYLAVCLLALLAVGGLQANPPHPVHLSLCELRLNGATRSFEVSVKIFIDDLEATLGADGYADLRIGTDREGPATDQAILQYLKKHLRVEIDGKGLDAVLHGKEVTDDYLAVWCYVEYPGLPAGARTCRVTNDILFERYDDQKNILDVKMSATHKATTILEPGRTWWQYSF